MSSQIESPSARPRNGDRRDLGRGLEVAPLVEHVVGRQQRLAHDVRDPAAVDQRGAVGDGRARTGRPAAAPGNPTTHRRRAPTPAPRQRRAATRARRVEEGRPLEQVLRRVAGQRELGKDDQLGALRARPRRVASSTSRRLPVEVADGRVDLSERDLHARHSTDKRATDAPAGAAVDRVIKFRLCPSGPPRSLRDTPVPTASRDADRVGDPAASTSRASNRVYVNRNLRLDKIEMVGFDMDYTLALYNQARIEELSMRATLHKLVTAKGYPAAIQRARLRPDAGGARPGRRPRQRQHLQARPLRLPGARAPRPVDASIASKVGELYQRERMRLSNQRYAWIDSLFALPEAVLYAVPGRLLRSPRRARQARLHDAVGAHPRVHRPRPPRRIDQGDRQRASCPTTSSATRRWPRRCTSSARRGSGCSC